MNTQELGQAFWQGVKVVSLLPDDEGATGVVTKLKIIGRQKYFYAARSIAYVQWDDGQLSWSPIEFLERL